MPTDPNPDHRKKIQDALTRPSSVGKRLPQTPETPTPKAFYKNSDGEWVKGEWSTVRGNVVTGNHFRHLSGEYRRLFKRPIPVRPFRFLHIWEKVRLLSRAIQAGKPIPEDPVSLIEIWETNA